MWLSEWLSYWLSLAQQWTNATNKYLKLCPKFCLFWSLSLRIRVWTCFWLLKQVHWIFIQFLRCKENIAKRQESVYNLISVIYRHRGIYYAETFWLVNWNSHLLREKNIFSGWHWPNPDGSNPIPSFLCFHVFFPDPTRHKYTPGSATLHLRFIQVRTHIWLRVQWFI